MSPHRIPGGCGLVLPPGRKRVLAGPCELPPLGELVSRPLQTGRSWRKVPDPVGMSRGVTSEQGAGVTQAPLPRAQLPESAQLSTLRTRALPSGEEAPHRLRPCLGLNLAYWGSSAQTASALMKELAGTLSPT